MCIFLANTKCSPLSNVKSAVKVSNNSFKIYLHSTVMNLDYCVIIHNHIYPCEHFLFNCKHHNELEIVWRKAVSVVYNQPYRKHQQNSVSIMLETLQWESLESCHTNADITMLYKALNLLVAIPQQYHHVPAPRNTRANHSYKLKHIRVNRNTYKSSIFLRSYPSGINNQPN